MNLLLPLLVAGGVVLVASGRRRGSRAKVILTPEDFAAYGPDVAAVHLRVGETLALRFPSSAIPFWWVVAPTDPSLVAATAEAIPCPEPMPGCVSTNVRRYLALAPGEMTIFATYGPTDPNQPRDREHTIPVIITE